MKFKFFLIIFCFSFSIAQECGKPQVLSGLIFNGEEAIKGEFPFLMALFEIARDKFFCGANLISKRHALTGL